MFAGRVESPFLTLSVRREHVFEDSKAILAEASEYELRKQLKVIFIGEYGVDEGGPIKEYFMLVSKEMLDRRGLFRRMADDRFLWIEAESKAALECETCGFILGLAIYNGIQLDVSFPIAMYKLLLSRKVTLRDYDEELAQSMDRFYRQNSNLKEFGFETFGEFEDDYIGKLMENENLKSLIRGFRRVCGDSLLLRFKPEEAEQLLCGSQIIDFHKLKEVAQYDGGFTHKSPVVDWFWTIVLWEMSNDQRLALLHFVTGSNRIPIGGIASLTFVIMKNGGEDERLPTSQTCFNTLLLNEYQSREQLKKYLFLALEHSYGFGLC